MYGVGMHAFLLLYAIGWLGNLDMPINIFLFFIVT